MQVYIFKTNIPTQKKAKTLNSIFKQHRSIRQWTIDTEDIDKVLRIEAVDQLSEYDFMKDIQKAGYACDVLNY